MSEHESQHEEAGCSCTYTLHTLAGPGDHYLSLFLPLTNLNPYSSPGLLMIDNDYVRVIMLNYAEKPTSVLTLFVLELHEAK